MAEITGENDAVIIEDNSVEPEETYWKHRELFSSVITDENNSRNENKEISNSTELSKPRLVRLERRNESLGLKVRGQVSKGGPRWLIDGKVFQNLHTISHVTPESSAEKCGVKIGDKILSINDTDVEGVQHEKIKDLMLDSENDVVEMVLVTPGEAKMIDIPETLVIHKSDGTTVTVEKESLLKNEPIDAITEEDEKEDEAKDEEEFAIKVEVHASSEEHNEDDGEEKEKEESNPNNEEEDETEEETKEEEETEEGKDEEQQENNVDVNESILVEDDDKECNNSEEDTFKASSIAGEASSIIEICSCGTEAGKKQRRKAKRNKQEELIKQMKMMCASIKKLKVSPFSPDIFNNLSPYFSVEFKEDKSHEIRMRRRQPRSCRYSYQRPTALSVLDPADAYRLEKSDIKKQVRIWSSNLNRRENTSEMEAKDEALKLRQANSLYRLHNSTLLNEQQTVI
eukprot:gene12103-13354_t